MSSSHNQIRVSDRVKRILDRRRRTDESYNDFLERVLVGSSTHSQIDIESETQSDYVSLHRKRAELRRNTRVRRLTTDDTDTDN